MNKDEGKAWHLAREFVVQQGHPEAECLSVGIGSDHNHYSFVYDINGVQVEVAVELKTGQVGFKQNPK